MRITLASAITLVRLLLLPPIVLLLLGGERLSAFFLLLVALAADLVDGALARLRGEVTPLGQLLDPAVDKVVFLTLLATLVSMGDLHWASLASLALLHGGILGGALVWVRRRTGSPVARPLGKGASSVLSMGVLATLVDLPHGALVVYSGIGLSYLAGLDYLLHTVRTLRGGSAPTGKAWRDKAEIGAEEGP